MKAMRLHAINDFRLEEVEKPQPRGKEILIKVGACEFVDQIFREYMNLELKYTQ